MAWVSSLPINPVLYAIELVSRFVSRFPGNSRMRRKLSPHQL